MNNNMNNSYKLRQINVYHMMLNVLQHYRSLVVVMVVGIVVGGVIGYYKKMTAPKAANQVVIELSQMEIDDDTASRMQMARGYYDTYKNLLSYTEDSILYNVDASNMSIGRVNLWVESQQYSPIIAEEYVDILSSDENICEVGRITGIASDAKYIRELITVESATRNDIYTQVKWIVLGQDEEIVEEIIKCLESQIDKSTVELKKKYNDMSVQKSSRCDSEVTNKDLMYVQKNVTVSLNEAMAAYLVKRDAFSEEQRAYFEKFILKNTEVEDIIRIGEEDADVVSVSISQYIIMGMVAAIILWFLLLSVKYISNNKVKTIEELNSLYEGRIYGVTSDTEVESGNRLDKKILEAMHAVEGLELSRDYVKKDIELLDMQWPLIVCSSKGNFDDTVLPSSLQGKVHKYIASDEMSLETAREVGHEIVIVELGCSRSIDVINEIMTANRHGIVIEEIICLNGNTK